MIDALKEQLRVAIGRQFDFPRRGLKTVMIQRLASLAMLFTLVILPRGIAQNHVHTHHGIIEWSATLSHVEDPVQAAWLHRPSQLAQRVGPAAIQASRNRSISALVIGLNIRNASAFSRTWSVLRIETQHDANRSSVQIACRSAG